MITSTIEKSNRINRDLIPDFDDMRKAFINLRAINHKVRRDIIKLLQVNKKLTVTDIYIKMRLEQSIASQHLAILRNAGVVKTERDGKFVFYSLNNGRLEEITGMVKDLAQGKL